MDGIRNLRLISKAVALSWVNTIARSLACWQSNPLEQIELRRRGEGKLALPPVGFHRPTPFVGLGRPHDEVLPTTRIPHVDAGATQKSEIDTPLPIVFLPLRRSQAHGDPLRFVVGQILAGKLHDIPSIDLRADEIHQLAFTTVGALDGSRQTKPEGSEASLRGKGVRLTWQVVALIEDHQPKTVAEMVHVEVGRVVRRHRQLLDGVVTATDEADGTIERPAESVVPLANQIERRRDDEGAAAPMVHGHHRNVGLASTGGQHHDSSTLGLAPRGHRLALVRTRFEGKTSAGFQFAVPARGIVVLDLLPDQPADEIGVTNGRCSEGPGPFIPQAPLGGAGRSLPTLDDDGACVKPEQHPATLASPTKEGSILTPDTPGKPVALHSPAVNQHGEPNPQGVTYREVEDGYFERRGLRRHARVWSLWALGVGAVISGDFFGWNYGLGAGGFGGLLIATGVITLMYVGLCFSIAEMSPALPHTGGAYSFARRAMGPWGGYVTGLAENLEFIPDTRGDRDRDRRLPWSDPSVHPTHTHQVGGWWRT